MSKTLASLTCSLPHFSLGLLGKPTNTISFPSIVCPSTTRVHCSRKDWVTQKGQPSFQEPLSESSGNKSDRCHNWRRQAGTKTTGVGWGGGGYCGTKECTWDLLSELQSASSILWPSENVAEVWSGHAISEEHPEIWNVLWNLPVWTTSWQICA